MERLARLPKMTPAEVAAQKEKEYGPVGLALGQRFLSGAILANEIAPELRRFSGEAGRIVRRALMDALCRSIELNDEQKSRKALSGIRELVSEQGAFPESAEQDLAQIFAEYGTEKERRSRKLEEVAIEKLRNLGISGTALRANMEENEAWQQEMQNLQQDFEPRLQKIRELLSRS